MEYEDCVRQALKPKYDCFLFDLDAILYPHYLVLAKALLQNSKDYMVEKLGIDRSKTDDLASLLLRNYGSIVAGLMAIGYDFDLAEYGSFVHGRLPYENLKPDPYLRNILLSQPCRKLIFTSANKIHAEKILSGLGLEDCFERIISFETLNPIHKKIALTEDEDEFESNLNPTKSSSSDKNGSEIFDIIGHFAKLNAYTSVLPKTPVICKPSEQAIELALKIANLNPQRTLFFEDSVRAIQAGKRLGLHTVQVGASQRAKGADYALESIHNLKKAVPELWETDFKSEVAYPGKLASYENNSKCTLRRSEMIPYYY